MPACSITRSSSSGHGIQAPLQQHGCPTSLYNIQKNRVLGSCQSLLLAVLAQISAILAPLKCSPSCANRFLSSLYHQNVLLDRPPFRILSEAASWLYQRRFLQSILKVRNALFWEAYYSTLWCSPLCNAQKEEFYLGVSARGFAPDVQ